MWIATMILHALSSLSASSMVSISNVLPHSRFGEPPIFLRLSVINPWRRSGAYIGGAEPWVYKKILILCVLNVWVLSSVLC